MTFLRSSFTTQLQRSLPSAEPVSRRKTNNELRTEGALPASRRPAGGEPRPTQNIRVTHQLNHRRILRVGALLNSELGKTRRGLKSATAAGMISNIRRQPISRVASRSSRALHHAGHPHPSARVPAFAPTDGTVRAQVAPPPRGYTPLASRTVAEEAYCPRRSRCAASGNDHEAIRQRDHAAIQMASV